MCRDFYFEMGIEMNTLRNREERLTFGVGDTLERTSDEVSWPVDRTWCRVRWVSRKLKCSINLQVCEFN